MILLRKSAGIVLPSTGLVANISNVAGAYFLSNCVPSIVPYTSRGLYAYIVDGVGKVKKVLIEAAGTGETLDNELIDDTGFDTDANWTKETGWTVSSSKAVATAVPITQVISNTASSIGAGMLIKYGFTISDFSAGSISMRIAATVSSGAYTTDGAKSGYLTNSSAVAKQAALRGESGGAGTTLKCDDFTVKQVLTPSATGALFAAISEDAGWNPNTITSFYIKKA